MAADKSFRTIEVELAVVWELPFNDVVGTERILRSTSVVSNFGILLASGRGDGLPLSVRTLLTTSGLGMLQTS